MAVARALSRGDRAPHQRVGDEDEWPAAVLVEQVLVGVAQRDGAPHHEDEDQRTDGPQESDEGPRLMDGISPPPPRLAEAASSVLPLPVLLLHFKHHEPSLLVLVRRRVVDGVGELFLGLGATVLLHACRRRYVRRRGGGGW